MPDDNNDAKANDVAKPPASPAGSTTATGAPTSTAGTADNKPKETAADIAKQANDAAANGKWFHDADHSASAERLAAQHARDVAAGVNVPLEGTDDKSRPGMREDQKPGAAAPEGDGNKP